VGKRHDPAKLSARARHDAVMNIEVRRVPDQNFSVYGVRKVWRPLKREGLDVARRTVSRLMRTRVCKGRFAANPSKLHQRQGRAMRWSTSAGSSRVSLR
jgi:hypothetical protein